MVVVEAVCGGLGLSWYSAMVASGCGGGIEAACGGGFGVDGV